MLVKSFARLVYFCLKWIHPRGDIDSETFSDLEIPPSKNNDLNLTKSQFLCRKSGDQKHLKHSGGTSFISKLL